MQLLSPKFEFKPDLPASASPSCLYISKIAVHLQPLSEKHQHRGDTEMITPGLREFQVPKELSKKSE